MDKRRRHVIKEIFRDHWDDFYEAYKDKIRPVVVHEVEKMLKCMDIQHGYTEYRCKGCGEVKKVGFSCKSRICTSCGKIYTDNWIEEVTQDIMPVPHRHAVFTILEELRYVFLKDRKLLKCLPDLAAKVVKDWYKSKSKKKEYTPGIITAIHTFGRDLKWNPHVHMLITEGAMDKEGDFKEMEYIHYAVLRRSWQYLLLTEIQRCFKKDLKIKKIISKLFREKDKGLYVYAKGRMKNAKGAVRYIGRYVSRPAIAESRIKRYDGKEVTFYYERHEDSEKVEVTISAQEFIKKLIRHIPDRQFKMVRYYGIYARRSKYKVKQFLTYQQKQRKLKWKKLNWRERIQKVFGYDPLKCEKCGKQMEVYDVYYPKYGSMMEIFQKRMLASVEKEMKEYEEMQKALLERYGEDYIPLYV
jgi:hypothetical protein